MSGTAHPIAIDVNRNGGESLAASTDAVSVSGSFDLLLRGHSVPAHAHCRIDGDLDAVASIDHSNHYVKPDERLAIPVTVAEIDDPVTGTLSVSIGYGTETVDVEVTAEPAPSPIDVDETLSTPSREPAESTALERVVDDSTIDPATLGVVALGVAALGIGLATTAVVGGVVAVAGLLAVLAGVGVAGFLLVS
ncbi:hypothetical protein OB905_11965 [Halobacteria archaeon AArc-dxtr1]|nr:hypothetical protein [Halobacteria archaeon AArc-dxtr1]